jgi:DNA-binding HxlR family transcriptional regulator
MLARSLKELQEAGLVIRKQYEEMPVRVEYFVTPLVENLIPTLRGLAQWYIKTSKS